jgi:hypothetical protein
MMFGHSVRLFYRSIFIGKPVGFGDFDLPGNFDVSLVPATRIDKFG